MTTRLAVGDDDHPEAALKHLEDAKVLERAKRFDGAAYLAGYVAECSFKTIVLVHQAFNEITKAFDVAKLTVWHNKLRYKPFGHDLSCLLAESTTPSGAKYVPDPSVVAPILGWRESLRYCQSGHVGEADAKTYLAVADEISKIILEMQADGVLR